MNRFYVVFAILIMTISGVFDIATHGQKSVIDYTVGSLLFVIGIGYLLFKGKVYP